MKMRAISTPLSGPQLVVGQIYDVVEIISASYYRVSSPLQGDGRTEVFFKDRFEPVDDALQFRRTRAGITVMCEGGPGIAALPVRRVDNSVPFLLEDLVCGDES